MTHNRPTVATTTKETRRLQPIDAWNKPNIPPTILQVVQLVAFRLSAARSYITIDITFRGHAGYAYRRGAYRLPAFSLAIHLSTFTIHNTIMSEDATPPRPKAKKLPFKPTALRKSASQKLEAPSDEGKPKDDGLDLFRRRKEMEPIMAADRERRKKKKQKQDEERRKSAESAKRPLDDDAMVEDEVVAGAELLKSPLGAARSGTPVAGSSKDGDVIARFVYLLFLKNVFREADSLEVTWSHRRHRSDRGWIRHPQRVQVGIEKTRTLRWMIHRLLDYYDHSPSQRHRVVF